jgi:hypothetical protein
VSAHIPKLRIIRDYAEMRHRSGWAYAMRSLSPLGRDDGVLLDGFVEENFGWRDSLNWDATFDARAKGDRDAIVHGNEGLVPYQEPWLGFMHVPPDMPRWFDSRQVPESILSKAIWLDSLPHCRGLYCLSQAHATWLQERVDVPVTALVHPTEQTALNFDPDAFLNSAPAMVVQVGWWLRRLHSIYELPTRTYKKVFLKPKNLDPYLRYERRLIRFDAGYDSAEVMQFLADDAYDKLLSKSVVFMHLYASSANNALVECIVRATPVLVNPLESVREYLGDDYPLYFETLEEAARKVEDRSLVLRAHEHLKRNPILPRLDGAYFCQSVAESSPYLSL